MANDTTETTEKNKNATQGEHQQPPPDAPPPAPKVETRQKDDNKEPKEPKEPKQSEPKRAKLKDDDDDIPEDAELLELSPTALKGRLRRASKKELRDRFGTDDPNEIKKKLDRLQELEAKEEERENANKSELEKERAAREKAESRAKQAEDRLTAVYDARVIEKEENRIYKIAEAAGMDPEYIEDQFPKFARFLNENFKERDLKKMTDKDIKKWFEERIKAKPKLARETTSASAEKEEKAKTPLTNGPGSRAPSPAGAQGGGDQKTMKPGQQNSMTRQEARAEMRKQGIQY